MLEQLDRKVIHAIADRGHVVLATQVRLAIRHPRPEHPRIIAENVKRAVARADQTTG